MPHTSHTAEHPKGLGFVLSPHTNTLAASWPAACRNHQGGTSQPLPNASATLSVVTGLRVERLQMSGAPQPPPHNTVCGEPWQVFHTAASRIAPSALHYLAQAQDC